MIFFINDLSFFFLSISDEFKLYGMTEPIFQDLDEVNDDILDATPPRGPSTVATAADAFLPNDLNLSCRRITCPSTFLPLRVKPVSFLFAVSTLFVFTFILSVAVDATIRKPLYIFSQIP